MDNVVINITEIQDNVQITLNECITEVVTDGVTVTGNGTISNPLVAAAGSGDMLRATYDPTNKNADAFSMENMVEGATNKILTSTERTKLNNLSGTNTGDQDLTPYLTSATAAATYQPIGAYLTTISGLNISQLTNDSGYITSAALAPYLTTSAASSTYQPILVSGTTIKTINGNSLLGAGDITISAAAALSGITSATAANTINNAAFQQEWKWNQLASGVGLKLSSTSTAAASNTQTIFQIEKSGANANANQTSYVQKISHTGTGTHNVNIGLKINVSGGTGIKSAALVLNASGGVAPRSIIVESGGGAAELNGEYLYFSSNKYIKADVWGLAYDAADRPHIFSTSYPTPVIIGTSIYGSKPFSINHASANNYELVFGGDIASGYRSDETSNNTIKATGGTLSFSAQTGLAGGFAAFTPNYIMHIYGTNQNVGIGTATPVASALLDLTSTTKGFAPPEMTATQASAISTTSRKLIIYVTDTNGTFTSAGLWLWTGTTWKLILAE